MYVFTCPNVGKYVKCQYDSDGTGCKASQVFIGHDLAVAPALYAGARTAY